jgi:hypothetical protein
MVTRIAILHSNEKKHISNWCNFILLFIVSRYNINEHIGCFKSHICELVKVWMMVKCRKKCEAKLFPVLSTMNDVCKLHLLHSVPFS